MKHFALVAFFALFELVVSLPGETYPTSFDKLDLDQVLSNDRLVHQFCECLLGRSKKCPKEAEDLLKYLPDALEHDCEKCTEAQMKGAKKAIKFLIQNKRECWTELVAKYDPQGKYQAQYAEEFKKEGINF